MKRLAVLLTLVALACDAPFTPPAYVAAVRVTPDSAALEAGGTIQLSAVASDSAGHTVSGARFVWSSANDSVAIVTAGGLVQSLRPGVVRISAAVQGITGRASLHVAVHYTAVVFDQPPFSMVPGGTVALSATARDGSGDTLYGPPLTWGTSDTSVLTVSVAGVATARAAGSAFLTVEAGHLRDSVAVTVGLVRFVQITTGEWDHTCGLTSDSVAYCWGSNELGQLGLPSAVTWIPAPVSASTTPRFATLAAGAMFTCGVQASGVVYCWGSSAEGRLGGGFTQVTHVAPKPVLSALTFSGLTAGWAHACGLSGEVAVCWGRNPAAGNYFDINWTPTVVVSAPPFINVTAANAFTCAVGADSAAYCWGDNSTGQLGDGGGTSISAAPVAVLGGLSLAQVAGGWNHACGITGAGAAYCWGANQVGQLGTGDTASVEWAPVAVPGGLVFTAIAAGGNRTCGLTASGVAYCWGDGVFTPTQVGGTVTFASIVMGDADACGIGTDGIAYCWGSNGSGQLGDGTLTDRAQPTRVLGQP